MIWKEERMKEEIVVRYKFVIEIKVWNYDEKKECRGYCMGINILGK